MAEPVTFHSIYSRLSLQVKAERKGFRGEEPFIIPAVLAQFENRNYTTADPEIIEGIRKSPAYARHEVFEVEDEKAPLPPNPDTQKVFRGAVGTVELHGELGHQPQKQAGAGCPTCGKSFPDDLGGKKLRMHMVSAHRIPEAKAAGVSLEEKTE